MEGQLSLTVVELLILVLGAMVLGMTIHFIIFNRMPLSTPRKNPREEKLAREMESWKDRFFTETELRDKEIDKLKRKLAEAEENTEIYTIEAEEVRKENKELKLLVKQLEAAPTSPPAVTRDMPAGSADKSAQLHQLAEAQESLALQQEHFRKMLDELARSAGADDRLQELKEYSEELELKVEELELQLSRKEQELNSFRREHKLSGEMNSMLENAYNEFGQLQEKLKKLEAQAVENKKMQVSHEDLKESHQRLADDLAELKNKHTTLHTEHLRLQNALEATEDELKQARFENQQLQSRMVQYDELNQDLRVMGESNMKLENQLKRIGELESMLNMMAEEREQLLRRSNTK